MFVPASPVLRLINHIVDYVIGSIVALSSALAFLIIHDHVTEPLPRLYKLLWIVFVYYVALFGYYFLSEKFLGRTPGKYLTKTQVIDIDGNLSTLRIAGRTVARCIPFDDFSIFFNNNRTWHDSLSNTWVVKTQTLPEAKRPGKWQDRIITGLTIFLLLVPIGLVAAWPLYDKLTGGERIKLPTAVPRDLKVYKLEKVEHDDISYYSIIYAGPDRTIHINRLIAGFAYDPDETCASMLPKPSSEDILLDATNESSPYSSCKEIYKNKEQPWIKVIQQIHAHSLPNSTDMDALADYYITDPPYRLVIKVERGSMSKEEVIAMAASGLKTQKEQELRQASSHSRLSDYSAD